MINRIVCLAGLSLFMTTFSHAQQVAPCAEIEGYRKLDFWIGDWRVVNDAGAFQGFNSIRKLLDDCVVFENWTGAGGGEGKSWFYYMPAEDRWQQVWVTQMAAGPGATKEKHLIAEFDDGGLRFQGEIALPDGSVYLDRTTLTPRADGTVRQLIEYSTDAGATWQSGFDAIYQPAKSAEQRLRDTLNRFADAFRDADADVLAELVTDDYTHTNLGSAPIGKSEWLSWVASQRQKIANGDLEIKRYDIQDLNVELIEGVAGDSAIVTGRVISAGSRDDRLFRSEIRFTQFWTQRAGRWQRRAFHDAAM